MQIPPKGSQGRACWMHKVQIQEGEWNQYLFALNPNMNIAKQSNPGCTLAVCTISPLPVTASNAVRLQCSWAGVIILNYMELQKRRLETWIITNYFCEKVRFPFFYFGGRSKKVPRSECRKMLCAAVPSSHYKYPSPANLQEQQLQPHGILWAPLISEKDCLRLLVCRDNDW